MLRGGDDDASNMNGGTDDAYMIILMKAESRTPAYHIQQITMHYHLLENGYEEFTDDFDENTLATPIEKEHQDRSHNCKPTFMPKHVASDDDDTCSLEELGHFVFHLYLESWQHLG
jgi:hypothetical protein